MSEPSSGRRMKEHLASCVYRELQVGVTIGALHVRALVRQEEEGALGLQYTLGVKYSRKDNLQNSSPSLGTNLGHNAKSAQHCIHEPCRQVNWLALPSLPPLRPTPHPTHLGHNADPPQYRIHEPRG